MKNIIYIIILTSAIHFSCEKRKTYTCEVTHHTNIGAGVDLTLDRKFHGTESGKNAFENRNTDEKKTTVCH